MKFYIYLLLAVLLFSCEPSLQENVVKVSTMGTTGTIKYITANRIDFQKEIDSLLLDVNMSLSTYIDSSTISKFNRNELTFKESATKDIHFRKNFTTARKIWKESNYEFNPAILPLVNYWKVQKKQKESFQLAVDSLRIDSIVHHINSNNLRFKQLDFSAIAKGYGVDVVAYFLEDKGIENYMVEIGGEVHCKGVNSKNKNWKIGIEEPNENERNLYQVVNVKDKSMATSGNYRNFKVLDSGQKIVHIINPKTGYPEISNLLSASIITDNCMEADAYATACMVMGTEKCFDFILTQEKLECFLIYSNNEGQLQTKISEGFKPFLDLNEK
jgi:thiamine biosynthesis lipoprotein